MKIEASLLREFIYNVLLWTPGKGDAKKSPSGGFVRVTQMPFGYGINFLSTDSYVIVETGSSIPPGESRKHIFVTGEDLRGIEKALREPVREVVDIEILDDGLAVCNSFAPHQSPAEMSLWQAIPKLLYTTSEMKEAEPFAVDPRRVSKFSLLEPRDEYPLDFIFRETAYQQRIMLWRHGPFSRGALAPLDREVLLQNFGEYMWV